MERALQLARAARGRTSPNPPVGAVLVRGDDVVGEGWTQPAGEAHAEVMALRAAGDRAAGSTLYVTLEPCSHWGRTPPCTAALIDAGIARAHVAITDPNPLVHGDGIRSLRDHGITVTVGDHAGEAARLIEPFTTYITQHRPHVTLLDNATPEVESELRAVWDAVVEGDVVTIRSEETRIPVPPGVDAAVFLGQLSARHITTLLVTPGTELARALKQAGLIDGIVGQ